MGDTLGLAARADLDPKIVLRSLHPDARAVREEHRDWGRAKLGELLQKHGVSEDDLSVAFPLLAERVKAEVARLQSEGAPVELFSWVQQQAREAEHAAVLDPEPRVDFQEQLALAWQLLQAQSG